MTFYRQFRRANLLAAFPLLVIAFAFPANLSAAHPSVTFDCIPVVECVEVDSLAGLSAQGDERIVEAKFNVSVLFSGSHALEVEELLFTVTSPGRWLRVLDYSPKTEFSGSIVGPVQVTETTTSSRSMQATAPVIAGLASAGASLNGATSETKDYQTLPAKELHIASGTIEAGSGLFFKIKPSAQSSLEGSREFAAVLAVPSEWRAGVVLVSCQARGRQARYLIPPAERTQNRSFVVALYLAGDEEARRAARKYVDAPASTRKPALPMTATRGPVPSVTDSASLPGAFLRRLPFSKMP